MHQLSSTRTVLDDVMRITIADLRRLSGFSRGCRTHGKMNWASRGEITASVSISVDTTSENPFVDLDYLWNGNPIRYRVDLVTSPSNLGKGRIWYFLCPETGKRCRNLYLIGPRFLHREAFEGVIYDCQARSNKWRLLTECYEVSKLGEGFDRKYAKTHYRGRPTKRYLRWLKKAVRLLLREAETNSLFD